MKKVFRFCAFSTRFRSNHTTRRETKKQDRRGFSRRSVQETKNPFRYFVTRSSHLTIASMTSIDSPQATTNTVHVVHIGVWM